MIPVANHLWQSTLFAAAAGLLTLALRNNRARVRYSLWLAASIKFLLPFSILMAVGGHFGRHTPAAVAPSAFSSVVEQIGTPFAVSAPVTSAPIAHPSPATWIPALLFALWAVGFLLLLCSWWLRWRNLRAAIRNASPVDLPVNIKALTSPEFGEPGVVGVLNPILLLPDGVIAQLTPPQFEAVLNHELSHVRRRDNLATTIHMAVEALFWFHPLVWWLGARLMEERERACDEDVLQIGINPQAYAEGILKICELYLESPLPCVAGVAGGNLKQRIEEIMTHRIAFKLTLTKKALLTAAALSALVIPVAVGIVNAPTVSAQTPSIPQWQTAAGGKMAFEVASVKPADPGAPFMPPNFAMSSEDSYAVTAGRLFADFPVTSYIQFAYKLSLTREQMQTIVAHLPKWVTSESFIIQAKAPQLNPTKDQMRLMMQSLLADRFKLAIHFETKEVSVLALMLVKPGKMGPKLIPHDQGPPCDPPTPDVIPPRCGSTFRRRSPTGLFTGAARDMSPEFIASGLTSLANLDRPVIDRTGLTGKFDYKLEWTAEPNGPTPPNADAQPDLQGTTFLQALREQLGLKLESTKGPISTPVIDRIERPSEN